MYRFDHLAVVRFQEGNSPESIREAFPSLSLAQIYSALAFYRNSPEECQRYLAELDRRWDALEQVATPLMLQAAAERGCVLISHDVNPITYLSRPRH